MNRKPRAPKRSSSGGDGGRSLRQGGRAPPEFVPTLSFGHKFRFRGSYAFTNVSITRSRLLNLYSVATTTTNQFRLLTAVKIRRVSMWGQPVALGSANTRISIEWAGFNSPSTIHSDTASGVRASFISSNPPPDSSAAWWSISGSNEGEDLFKLTGPTGTVIDLDLELRFADNEAAVAAENGTAAAASVGRVYWNYLDGFASGILAPDGGVTALP